MIHGHPDMFDAGCKSNGNCPNSGSETLMTCKESVARQRGDYRYAQAVKDGTATAEKEQFRKTVDLPKPVKVRKSRATGQPRKSAELKPHGTRASYDRGCRKDEDCPMFGSGSSTCHEAMLEENRQQRADKKRLRDQGIEIPVRKNEIQHGTASGYKHGKCRFSDDKCPGALAGGLSCRRAFNEARRAANGTVDRKAIAVRITKLEDVPHGTRRRYQRGCKKPQADQCPSKLAGGISCADAQYAYNREKKDEAIKRMKESIA